MYICIYIYYIYIQTDRQTYIYIHIYAYIYICIYVSSCRAWQTFGKWKKCEVCSAYRYICTIVSDSDQAGRGLDANF